MKMQTPQQKTLINQSQGWMGSAALWSLLGASAAGLIWALQPQFGGWALLAALLPAGVTLLRRAALPWRRTPLDGFLLLFVLTAAMGVWTAYDRSGAWSKFWLILWSILMFYALASQPRAYLWPVVTVIGVLPLPIAAYFMLTHDWTAFPVKFPLLNQLAQGWMDVRPAVGGWSGGGLHPNTTGGLLAVLLPLTGAALMRQIRLSRLVQALLWSGVLAFALLVLIATASRGGWLALAAGAALWFMWAICGHPRRPGRFSQRGAFLLGLGLSFLAVLAGALLFPGGPNGLLATLPGTSSGVSRLDLMGDTIRLIRDFPFTGGGLGAFPGLYAHYILFIPFFFLGHAHNLFLNVALEQGAAGLAAVVSLFLVTFLLLIGSRPVDNGSNQQEGLIRGALLASLTALTVHAQIEIVLWNGGLFLLVLTAGLAVLLAGDMASPSRTLTAGGAAAVVLFTFFLAALFSPNLAAGWQANLGAVRMAQVELSAWPDAGWVGDEQAAALRPIAARFDRALALDGENRAANYRLGLIALQGRDFSTAVKHLEAARRLDPAHPGVRKTLGLAYAWTGDYEKSGDLLQYVPGAAAELDVYTWWWSTQGREDLAERAAEMLNYLENNTLNPIP